MLFCINPVDGRIIQQVKRIDFHVYQFLVGEKIGKFFSLFSLENLDPVLILLAAFNLLHVVFLLVSSLQFSDRKED
jgi:hypothetical protein